MKIREIEHNLQLLQETAPRTEGLHISQIYGSLFEDLEPSRFNSNTPRNDVKLALGLAWEVYLERVLVASGVNAERPGEFITPEGIYFSPDLFIVNGTDHIGEIKTTYMSSRAGIEAPKFDKWFVQAKAYCHQMGIPRVTFYVLFINGDYRSGEPEFRVWDCEFSARELQENYQMLMQHGRHKGLLK